MPRRFRPRTVCRLFAVLVAFAAADWAFAQDKTTVPLMSACTQAAPPTLPQRSRAVALMLPFTRAQIDVGEFVYDGALPAMRATLTGTEQGYADLLITATQTYRLSGPPEAPTSCIALGRKYSPPPGRWMSKARCDGEGPIAATKVQWWKQAAADGRSQSQWYRSDTNLPWRVAFPSRSADPAVIGDYGMSYFPTFTSVASTNLARLRDLCAKAPKASEPETNAVTARDLMALGPDLPGAERDKRIQTLIPGFSRQACTGATPARWPDRFVMTAILSPVPFKYTPLPSVLFYDWPGAGGLHGWMYETRTTPPKLELVSLLSKGIGYTVEKLPSGAFACVASSPGTVRPDWMAVAGCECKGVLDHNPDLGPNEVSQIRACPIKGIAQRVNWSWYTNEGRPILFAEPNALSTGFNIADYLAWQPGESVPRATFELPQLCTRADEPGLPPVGHGLPASATASCSDCHTTQP